MACWVLGFEAGVGIVQAILAEPWPGGRSRLAGPAACVDRIGDRGDDKGDSQVVRDGHFDWLREIFQRACLRWPAMSSSMIAMMALPRWIWRAQSCMPGHGIA